MASLYRNLLLHKAGPAQLIQWFYSQQEFDICGSKLPIGLTNPLINKGYMPGDNGARPWKYHSPRTGCLMEKGQSST